MSTELVLALVASVTSLLVAVASLVSSTINRREAARSEEKMETLRFEFARRLAERELVDAQVVKSMEALQLTIQAIQLVKDELQLILAAVETSLDSETAMERLSTARVSLFTCYEKYLAYLDDAEAKACHKAKNRSLVVESFLGKCFSQKRYASQLSREERQYLQELRSDLTDCQQLLRDGRANRLIRSMSSG